MNYIEIYELRNKYNISRREQRQERELSYEEVEITTLVLAIPRGSEVFDVVKYNEYIPIKAVISLSLVSVILLSWEYFIKQITSLL